MPSLKSIEGIGEMVAGKLEAAGIHNTEDMLNRGMTARGRKELSESTGVSETLILRYVILADLFRIKGVREEEVDLLEACGVESIPDLAQCNAATLYRKMIELNRTRKLVRQVPPEAQVNGWINQAKTLPRKISL